MLTTFAAVTLSIAMTAPAAALQVTSTSGPRDHAEAIRHLRLGQENLRGTVGQGGDGVQERREARADPRNGAPRPWSGLHEHQAPSAGGCGLSGLRAAFKAKTARLASNDLQAQRVLDDEIRNLEDQRTLLATARVISMMSGGAADLDRRINELRQRRFPDATEATATPTWTSIALGSAYFRSGAMADAEREYRAALAVDPKLGEAHSNLAVVCLLTGRTTEADGEIKAAEKSGFKVNPQLKADVKKALAQP